MSAPVIAVDIGNTSISAAEFSAGDYLAGGSAEAARELPKPDRIWHAGVADSQVAALAEWLPSASRKWFIGSVNRPYDAALREWLRGHRPNDSVRWLTYHDFPLELDVEHPETVGVDRLAAACAANHIRGATRPAIVVDSGSAVTVDVVSAEGVFCGGHIFPGMALSLRALSQGADLLPDVSPAADYIPGVGKHTAAAMRAGVFWATVGAIEKIVRRLQDELAQPCDVIATGGDVMKLLPYMDVVARHEPHLVLAGLLLAGTSGRG